MHGDCMFWRVLGCVFDIYHRRYLPPPGPNIGCHIFASLFVSSGKLIRNECAWTRPALRQTQDERRAPPVVIPRVGAEFSVAISRHFCLIMVEGGNRSREEPGVSGGFDFLQSLIGRDGLASSSQACLKPAPNLAQNALAFNSEQLPTPNHRHFRRIKKSEHSLSFDMAWRWDPPPQHPQKTLRPRHPLRPLR